MHQFRVTKYDPVLRDSEGRLTRDEWTSVEDIGKVFGKLHLSPEAYQKVEDAYVAVAMSFLSESGISTLRVQGLENASSRPLVIDEGLTVSLDRLPAVIRGLLREEFWCRLEGPDGFLHVGYDYYMYLGVPGPCPKSHELAHRSGLFIEEFVSPYRIA